MMSSRGAAVGFPGAKADSTGVSARGLRVGDGCWVRPGVIVGAAGAQAVMTKIENEISRVEKVHFFIRTPQEDFRKSYIAKYTVDTQKCPRSVELNAIRNY